MDESNLGEDTRSIREWLESRGGGRSKLPTVLVDTLENHLLNTLGLVSAQQVLDLGDGALLDVYEATTDEDDMDPILSKLIVRWTKPYAIPAPLPPPLPVRLQTQLVLQGRMPWAG